MNLCIKGYVNLWIKLYIVFNSVFCCVLNGLSLINLCGFFFNLFIFFEYIYSEVILIFYFIFLKMWVICGLMEYMRI